MGFPTGSKTGTIPAWVYGDRNIERDETFQVVLSKPAEAAISKGKDKATGTIVNDDNRRASAVGAILAEWTSKRKVAGLNQSDERLSSARTACDNDDEGLLYDKLRSGWLW